MTPEQRNRLYPDPATFTCRPRIHQRHRIVIQACDKPSALETVEKIKSLGLTCNLETFLALTDDDTGELRGEIVAEREFFTPHFAPVEAATEGARDE